MKYKIGDIVLKTVFDSVSIQKNINDIFLSKSRFYSPYTNSFEGNSANRYSYYAENNKGFFSRCICRCFDQLSKKRYNRQGFYANSNQYMDITFDRKSFYLDEMINYIDRSEYDEEY